MREISEFTRLNPERRADALKRFNDRIQRTQESRDCLDNWNMELSNDLLDVNARELPSETIVFGNSRTETPSFKAEWSIKGRTTMFRNVDCKRWVYFYPKTLERESLNFLDELINAAREMNYVIAQPLTYVIYN